MELTFVTNAIRRYWWIVVLAVFVGLIPGLFRGAPPVEYESRSVLLLSQPSDASRTVSGDPDRYVNSQISVLASDALTENVAARLGDGTSAASIRTSVQLLHQPETDIVEVVVTTPNPERSQEVGSAFIDEYFGSLREQVASAQEPEFVKLNEDVEAIREQIAAVDEEMAEALAPYLGRESIPDIEQVAPALATEKALLTALYQDKQTALSALDTNARLRVSSEIVQDATLPADPTLPPPNLLLAVGLVGGLGAGLFGAVLMARVSPTVLGEDQAEEILEHPVVGSMPKLVSASDRLNLLGELPRDAIESIEALCVRIEASAHEQARLTVVVTGTRYGVGVTTVAAAVARRFAERHTPVLLVDADAKDRELATLFTGRADRPLTSPAASETRPGIAPRGEFSTPTDLGNLTVADYTSLSGTTGMQARYVGAAITSAVKKAEVVIFDGGPLLAAASTVQLTRLCDVVVLAMAKDQDIRRLDEVADELRDRTVLPIWTPVRAGGTIRDRARRLLAPIRARLRRRPQATTSAAQRPATAQ